MKIIKKYKSRSYLVRLIFLFMFFTIFDGIFRKWLFPSLSIPIMVIKQIIAIWIVFKASHYYSKFGAWEKSFMIVGGIVFVTSLLFGHQNLLVAIWGCLPYFFGLTLCCIIANVLSFDDICTIGKIIVYFVPINAALTAIQLILPAGHWLNYKAGGEIEYESISAIELMGGFRPSGIFMSTGTLSLYLLMAMEFLLYFLFINQNVIKNKILLIIAYLCCWTTSICAVSRTCVFYVLGMTAYALFFLIIKDRKTLSRVIRYSVIFAFAFGLLLSTPLGESATENMGNRFTAASESNVGTKKSTLYGTVYDIYNRNIAYMVNGLIDPKTESGAPVPFLGYGQGMSTQVGGRLLYGENKSKDIGFALAEWDGLRIVCESGLMLGLVILFIRLGYVFRFFGSLVSYSRRNMYMSVFLYPTFLLTFFVMNTWGNVTNASFAFLSGGMFLAAKRIESQYYKQDK